MRDEVLSLIKRHLPGPFRASGGSNVLTKCPFHKDGQERKPSFSINLDEGLFHCFTCHEAGPLPRMLTLLGLPRHFVDTEVAIIKPLLERNRELHQSGLKNFAIDRDPFKAPVELPESLLSIYEWMPTSLVEKGFDPHLLQNWDVGFDRVNNRITYPIRDMYGTLAGVSGGASFEWQKPKYKVYEGRHRDMFGKWHDGDFGEVFNERFPDYHFENHNFLWNFERIRAALIAMSVGEGTLHVVEGFKACLWMIQSGFPNTVALMGSSISEHQQRMLHMLGVTIMLCLDNDEAGRRSTLRIGELLWRPLYGRITVMQYPSDDVVRSTAGDGDSQPDSYSPENLKEMTSNAKNFQQHLNQELRKEGLIPCHS